jgi:biofilm PGA synthesis N-glycosyltransferase PgaC
MNEYLLVMSVFFIVLGSIALVRHGAFMIGSMLYEIKFGRTKKFRDAADLPTMSVIIPAHNEGKGALNAVDSVLTSDYPSKKLQLIVIDDGSSDDTLSILHEHNRACGNAFTVLTQENQGKAHAINNAMKHVRGELVMGLDADSTVQSDALRLAAGYFSDPTVSAMCANVRIRRTDSLLNYMQYVEYLIDWQTKRALTTYNIEYIVGGIGSVFRYRDLKKVGFYDTDTVVEDMDLTLKLLKLGNKTHRIIFGADVVCTTEAVVKVKDLFKQRYRWRFGHLQALWKHKDLFFSNLSSRNLTWVYLPYAIFSELILFLKPLSYLFMIVLVFGFGDLDTPCTALAAVSALLMIYVASEHSISWKERLSVIWRIPGMYVLFLLLTLVWYISLLRTYAKLPSVLAKKQVDCRWDHVERATAH